MDPEAPLPSISQMLANPTHRTERYLGDISYDDGNPRQLKGYGTLLFMRSGTAYLLGLSTLVPYALFRGIYKVQKKGYYENAPFKVKVSEVANTLARIVPKRLNSIVVLTFICTSTYIGTGIIRARRDYFNLMPIPGIIGAYSANKLIKRFKGVPRYPFVATISASFVLFSIVPIMFAEGITYRYMRFKIFKYFKW